jgi:hypothetical protein
MAYSTEQLRDQILDLLVDGPSSFAAMYSAIVRYSDLPEPPGVDVVLDTLYDMERRKLVCVQKMSGSGEFRSPSERDRTEAKKAYQAWLPKALGTDLSFDKVGLWFKIEEEGRREWQRWSQREKHDIEGRWVLDELGHSQTIVVRAQNSNLAEEVISRWLSANPDVELIQESKVVEPVSEFELRNGEVVTGGVKIGVSYRRKSNPSRHFFH